MANIEILYNYENKEEIEEVVEVLIALGKLNYCVETRKGKGYLQLKKVHQEVVTMSVLERVAAAEQKITDDSILLTKTEVEFEGLTKSPAAKELEFPDHPIQPRPALHVYYIGDEYIAAYSQFDAVNLLVKRDRVPYKDVEKKVKGEFSSPKRHIALLDKYYVKKGFSYLLTKEYPSGVQCEWIGGECYFKLSYEFVLNYISYTEPFILAYEEVGKLFYNSDIGVMVEDYLLAEAKKQKSVQKLDDFSVTYG
ncbi:hypothetical protein CHOTACABRAS_181 [Bacillus phage Chotacabras]|nr:hypothetical protein CHOTACABRAS_181 [Bacillus phage Chotacabras]